MAAVYIVTGTDTGVGKTVLTALLVRYLRRSGARTMAVKPVCSGGRADARALRRAQSNEFTLDEINPWHFRAPVAPVLAARREGRDLAEAEIVDFIRTCASRCDYLLVEGAGGLLSPLGEGFDSRDLILKLAARPIIVVPDRVGAVNQARLALEALPSEVVARGLVVLKQLHSPPERGAANRQLIAEHCARCPILEMPYVSRLAARTETLAIQRWCRSAAGYLRIRNERRH